MDARAECAVLHKFATFTSVYACGFLAPSFMVSVGSLQEFVMSLTYSIQRFCSGVFGTTLPSVRVFFVGHSRYFGLTPVSGWTTRSVSGSVIASIISYGGFVAHKLAPFQICINAVPFGCAFMMRSVSSLYFLRSSSPP